MKMSVRSISGISAGSRLNGVMGCLTTHSTGLAISKSFIFHIDGSPVYSGFRRHYDGRSMQVLVPGICLLGQ
jgi:hypothetical protein